MTVTHTHRLAALIALGLVLVISAPAVAKGVDGVTLSSGGQSLTLDFSTQSIPDPAFGALVEATRFYEGMWTGHEIGTRPMGELGPQITAEWNFPLPEQTTIVQYLYPLAENGPVGHVPGGQVYVGQATAETWFPLADDVVEQLAAVGFDVRRLSTLASVWVVAVGAALVLSAIMVRWLTQRTV